MIRKLLPLLVLATPLLAHDARLEIIVNGAPRPQYFARGTTYIEALKGQEYEIRLTNPFPTSVAVTLSVDGLNTLDAKHTDARSGRKWVLGPFQSVTLRGWQTSSQQSRRFFFTSEETSYGQWLGKTENLGVISAAFFREISPMVIMNHQAPSAAPGARKESKSRAMSDEMGMAQKEKDYAATGIGGAEDHPVTQVQMLLEDKPAAVVSIRYEYRDTLISLGVLPQPRPADPAIQRREKARGFVDNGYCPSPK